MHVSFNTINKLELDIFTERLLKSLPFLKKKNTRLQTAIVF